MVRQEIQFTINKYATCNWMECNIPVYALVIWYFENDVDIQIVDIQIVSYCRKHTVKIMKKNKQVIGVIKLR